MFDARRLPKIEPLRPLTTQASNRLGFDFRLDTLTLSSTFSAEGSLFAHLGKHEIFTPTKTYSPMTVSELAAAFGDAPQEAA